MLHVLLIVLKILGILLLVILGLLLLGLLAVLFVPIWYRGEGNYHTRKEFGLHLHVHWLLHVVSLRIAYEDGLQYAVKLFGFRIFGSESGGKEAESKSIREKVQADKDLADEFVRTDSEDGSDLEMFLSGEKMAGDMEVVHAQEKSKEIEDSQSGSIRPETAGGTSELIQRAEVTSEKTDAAIEKAEETARLLEEAVKRRGARREAEASQTENEAEKVPDVKAAEMSGEERGANRKKQRAPFIFKITAWLKRKCYTMWQAFKHLFSNIQKMDHKRQLIFTFLEDEENQNSFRLMKRQLIRILRHVFPKKLSGRVTFGVEDPYLMGQILSVAAFLYPLYGKQIRLTPVMDAGALVLDGDVSFRGSVQIGVLALMLLRIWMDKNVRTQVHKYRNRGGR